MLSVVTESNSCCCCLMRALLPPGQEEVGGEAPAVWCWGGRPASLPLLTATLHDAAKGGKRRKGGGCLLGQEQARSEAARNAAAAGRPGVCVTFLHRAWESPGAGGEPSTTARGAAQRRALSPGFAACGRGRLRICVVKLHVRPAP